MQSPPIEVAYNTSTTPTSSVNEVADHLLGRLKSLRGQYLPTVLNSSSAATTFSADFLDRLEVLLRQLASESGALQWRLTALLEEFRRAQQKAVVSGLLGAHMESALDVAQAANSSLLTFYLTVAGDLKQVLSHQCFHTQLAGDQLQLANVHHRLSSLLEEVIRSTTLLLQGAFIIVEQPCSSILKHDPLTIISNAKFDVKLALLLDYHLLSSVISSNSSSSSSSSSKSTSFEPQVDFRLLKEEEIGTVLCEGLQAMLQAKPSFNIINKAEPTYSCEEAAAGGGGSRLTISITCMLKVDINRRGHNPKAPPVAEEKFKFLFFTRLDGLLHQFDRQLVLHTFSLPVNVLSRKDYRNSYATILWDCAFALEGRRLFEVRETVSWSELAAVLSAKWRKDVGLYLEEHHLEFIATMIPNGGNSHLSGQNNNTVSWEQFAKITLPQRNFTFFEWFYRSLVLVREGQLLSLYTDGLVHGFISSEVAEALLLDCVDGTFLLRFSETYCGSISVAYVTGRRFDKLFPWDVDRLRKISLAHTVKCLDFLLYLYPNVPKDEVFCKYYVTGEESGDPAQRSVTGKDYKRDTNIAQVISGGGGDGYSEVGMLLGSPNSSSSGGFFTN